MIYITHVFQKSLKLPQSSNTYVMEWLLSPVDVCDYTYDMRDGGTIAKGYKQKRK